MIDSSGVVEEKSLDSPRQSPRSESLLHSTAPGMGSSESGEDTEPGPVTPRGVLREPIMESGYGEQQWWEMGHKNGPRLPQQLEVRHRR